MKKNPILLFLFLLSFSMVHSKSFSKNPVLVHNIIEFGSAVANAKPGDEILLANGIWNNVELLFEGKGTLDNPITLGVEEKGKVILSGASNLRIAGAYLVVKGLVFKNGFTPTTELISFKKDARNLAYNCRLTQCVIDDFSNPERQESDYWIALYGKNNRLDHNHIEGKRNLGVTVAVILDSKESQENNHQIDHNYFGSRPTLGSNGGETIRIGTSQFSLTNSRSLVEYNYFDHCSGELEIISNKSCENTYRYNTFFECKGILTLRHGSKAVVDGNVFIGNGKPNTGGIRVINGNQTVINNYCIGLTGYRLGSAFVIMNGLPNSPLSRYHQVKDAVIKNNTFVNCDHIQFCAGSDKERSATPINSLMANTIFYNDKANQLFTLYDDISGIQFTDNYTSSNVATNFSNGFQKVKFKITKNKMGLLIPESKEIKTAVTINSDIATKENTGTQWYPKGKKETFLNSGKTIAVLPGINTLYEAAIHSNPGDIIELNASETYYLTKTIPIRHPLTFRSNFAQKPKIFFEKKVLFEIENGGSLSLDGLQIDGAEASDYAGNAVISNSKYSMNRNYNLLINNCDFTNLNINHSFDVIAVYKNTIADTIQIKNSNFKRISGNIVALDKETDDLGIYNAENVILENNSFTDIDGAVLSLYRGGADESTFGPFLEINHCVFDNVGNGKRNKYKASLSTYGVQVNQIKNNIFDKSKGVKIHLIVGDPVVQLLNNNYYATDKVAITGDQKYLEQNTMSLDPGFKSKATYELNDNSPLKGKATDGSDIGLVTKGL
jgi:poly(beta-D-mannuronate) lyase